MADQFTKGTGQPQTSGFTPQEEEAGAAFGLDAGWAGEMYQATAPTYAPPQRTSGWGGGYWSHPRSMGLPVPTDTGQRKVVDAFVDLTTMGPDKVSNLQKRLYDAGFYDASYYKRNGPKIHFGQLDDALVSAYSDVIRQSMRSKKPLNDIVNEGIQKGYGEQEAQQATSKPPPLTVQLTDSNDLLAVADATARKLLGRKLTDAELRNYVDSFHSMEAASQQAKYNAEYSSGYDEASGSFRGPGGTITAPPTPDAYAMEKLKADNPQDAANVEMEHGMDVFNQLLRGQGG
jgi:hypothetical protein